MSTSSSGPQRSVEGWVLIVTGIHDEASEDDVEDAFIDFGNVQKLTCPRSRSSGRLLGYALIEFAEKEEAADAIINMDKKPLLGKEIRVDYA
eukprot:CAMPEP_0182452990 /NCGR_PEP_ID=MMETSP1319-20130603/245_1 /TAXON_ID=172717 /ORGANISM="Bolidomonas pacifica, Strain RCC208" /LENGTH=91 /DNA_ID=CAMNT_0024650875 /DNA_START=146 /DNA_END=417 /DNA_ORIENTATION=+